MSNFRIIALAVALLGSPVALAVTPEISFTDVRYQVLADEQRFDGVVEAVYRSTLSAQTAGEIIELPFDVNDYVPKGAVVLRIDDTKQKARLDKAVASAAQAQAVLAEAESSHRRNLRLIKENAVSKSQLDKSEANLKSARAQLELAQAAAKEAREQWEYTVVHAPFAGVMVERFVEVGEQVQIGTRLGTGLSLEKLRVQVQVPAYYAQRIRATQRSRVQLPDSGDWLASEDLTLFPYADPDSHSFTVRVQLPPGQHGLFPGMLVKVAFTVGETRHLVVPSRAVVHRSEVTGVYVQADNQALRFRQVRIGREVAGDLTEVLAGLQDGEQVALDPVAAGIALKRQDRRHE
ncbi:MAG: efflux RND transporter periplasmic adaptor subunit [Thiogranum sp.]